MSDSSIGIYSANDSSTTYDKSVDLPLTDRDEIQEIQKMAKNENDKVDTLRVVLYVFVLCTAIGVVGTTFEYLRLEQENEFRKSFEEYASSVNEASVRWAYNLDATISTNANMISSLAASTNQEWPEKTIPYFESNVVYRDGLQALFVAPRVEGNGMSEYERYTLSNHAWLDETDAYEQEGRYTANPIYEDFNVDIHVQPYTAQEEMIESDTTMPMSSEFPREFYWPIWQQSPIPHTNNSMIGVNLDALQGLSFLSEAVLSTPDSIVYTGFMGSDTASTRNRSETVRGDFYAARSVISSIDGQNSVVAIVAARITWDSIQGIFFQQNIPKLNLTLEKICDDEERTTTFDETYIFPPCGSSECATKPQYEALGVRLNFTLQHLSTSGLCSYNITMFPTDAFHDKFLSDAPQHFAIVVGTTFLVMVVLFIVYDVFVYWRNEMIVANAARSNAIVSSIFPDNVRDRLMVSTWNSSKFQRTKNLQEVMTGSKTIGNQDSGDDDEPLADLFLETSILFADIVGFTAWSSAREPSHVFKLLESLFGTFDEMASKVGVFKVETVGDCYVAATGLPSPRSDHAIAMVRFARAILMSMQVVTKRLETSLGPDTSGLTLRIGIHSGSVTAGVLRGKGSRFQLFGDTMNTASRMESNGKPGRIHISQQTADLVIASGRQKWLERREDVIEAKGKGSLTTYWVSPTKAASSSGGNDALNQSLGHGVLQFGSRNTSSKDRRLVEWMVEMLARQMFLVVARRKAVDRNTKEENETTSREMNIWGSGGIPMHDVQEILPLADFGISAPCAQTDGSDMSEEALEQLKRFVYYIADMYNPNFFHGFDHACHVSMSVMKLLSRITAPELNIVSESNIDVALASKLHDHTYGITSDPLTQLACAFSALIHDVDHPGVPNTRLSKENPELAEKFEQRSIAEQNSLVISFGIFMSDEFKTLRDTLFETQAEADRFRAIVTNLVLATDIVDGDLKALRNKRWTQAFSEPLTLDTTLNMSEQQHSTSQCHVKRRATVVLEHLIQASDVSHTMQHWKVYRKWNERFFFECYDAFQSERCAEDPTVGWYSGELGFFDFYIIPLAKKLKECGVFGKSGDEYLNYAMKNREEWEANGKKIVEEMVEEYNCLPKHSGSFER